MEYMKGRTVKRKTKKLLVSLLGGKPLKYYAKNKSYLNTILKEPFAFMWTPFICKVYS